MLLYSLYVFMEIGYSDNSDGTFAILETKWQCKSDEENHPIDYCY